MGNTSRLCLLCGQVFSSDAERKAHIESAHPGQRVEWRDKRPFVVTGDGTATRIGPSALKRMRRDARAVTGGQAATRGRAVVRRAPAARKAAPEPVAVPVMVETPLPDDPDAPPYFEQVQPFHVLTGGATMPPAGEPIASGLPGDDMSHTPSPAAIASREAIRLALTEPTLASMIRQLSVVISEWDGAGERGHLSAIESAQLAMLLHEPAITAVQRYFGGDVDRFRLALALGILLLGKGRIHLNAVRARVAERQVRAIEEPAIDAAQAAITPNTETEAEPTDPIAALAARQRAAVHAA